MKNLYKGFKQLSKEEFKSLWETAIFVFDTNVLLNLYRYQSSTRDNLLKVLDSLGERKWIPYHVGLEFERNRLIVIADQKKRFSEVRNAVEKSKSDLISDLNNLQLRKRHSLINPDKLVEGYQTLTKEFLDELDKLQEKQQDLTAFDPLREKIEDLFNNRVGNPPENQEIIDNINKDGEHRFKYKIPPGFEDNNKEKEEIDEFFSNGILYKRKYGDLVVWKQIIDYTKKSGIKSLIFVTDDNKEDWWQKINSSGPKTIGPRPELTDEIFTEAGVNQFYMYNPEGFLKYSKELLHTDVSEETIKEVRDISYSRSRTSDRARSIIHREKSAERAVYNWLENNFDSVEISHNSFPDFIANNEDRKYGFKVKFVPNPKMLMHQLENIIYTTHYKLKENDFDEVCIVFVLTNVEDIEISAEYCKILTEDIPEKLRIVIGVCEIDSTAEMSEFIPYDDFKSSKI